MTIPSNNPHKILVSDKLVLWKKILFYFMHSNQIDFSTCKYSPYSVLLLNIWADYFQQVFLPYLNGLFQKESKLGVGGGVRIYFFDPTPLEFFFFLHYPWKFQTKQSSAPWIFHKIVLDPLEIPRSKPKTPGNSTLFFFDHP